MTLDELLAGLSGLLDVNEPEVPERSEASNFDCVGCEDCSACQFCRHCRGCDECSYCRECTDCAGCTQTKRSVACNACTYVEDCRDCERGRYLRLCIDCVDCVHCLACVGLTEAEFCVLNEQYSRKEYFALLKELSAEIDRRLADGWLPDAVWEGIELVVAAAIGEPDDPGAVSKRAAPDRAPSGEPRVEGRPVDEPRSPRWLEDESFAWLEEGAAPWADAERLIRDEDHRRRHRDQAEPPDTDPAAEGSDAGASGPPSPEDHGRGDD